MTWLNFWVFFGFLGVLGHIGVQVAKHGGKKISDVGRYMSDNSLTVAWSVLCYIAAIAMWESGMLEDILGIVPGRFNVMTFIVGYTATDLVGAVLKFRTQKLNGTTYAGEQKAPTFTNQKDKP